MKGRQKRFKLIPGIPLLILGVVVLAAILAPYLAPYEPNKGDLYDQFIPPSWMEEGSTKHFLGTDYFGRDNFSRLIYGTRISLSIALITIILGGAIGTTAGLISGYFGGKIDIILMRLVDAWLSFPLILIAILLAVVVGPSYANVILILAVLIWPRYARQVRGEALGIKNQDFVALAKVAGSSQTRIICKHLFPNVLPTLIVLATFQVAEVILMEAMLSFLAVGVPPPTASWGSMAAGGRDYIGSYWWLSAFPGIAIFLTVLSVNLTGDWIRDRLDPKLRQV